MSTQYPIEAMLFQSAGGEEELTVSCSYDAYGLRVRQESAGDLTQWCFEESPHVLSVSVPTFELKPLLDYLHVDDPALLPPLLAAAYSDYDASQRVRDLLRRLHVRYEVTENPIVR